MCLQLPEVDPNEATPWYFAYAAIPVVFAKYPEAEGLMWSNDDVVINYWNYMQADKVTSAPRDLPAT